MFRPFGYLAPKNFKIIWLPNKIEKVLPLPQGNHVAKVG
jgi:hypothetical protein